MRARWAAAVAAAVTAGLMFVPTSPARAGDCWIDSYDPDTPFINVPPTPEIHFYCPFNNDVPVGAPILVVTYPFGWNDRWFGFAQVQKGGRLFFWNDDSAPHRYHGKGFDSGLLPGDSIAEVTGVSALPLGEHCVWHDYSTDGSEGCVADLYINPPITG